MIYRYNAESWDEFVHDLRTRKQHWCNGGSSAVDSSGWRGCDTWEDAMRFAVTGHPAARAAIESAAVKVSSAPEPQWDTAPVGVFACIPAHAAGVPADMFINTEDAPPTQSPVVRIAVNMSGNASIDAEEFVNRGAAIVTLIDRIQLSGRRVELIAIKHGESSCRRDRFIWSVTVKRPEEPIDMDRIGLAFATAIMLRRFFFRVMEFMVPREVVAYGYSRHFDEECKEFHMTIPIINEGQYSTPERANRKVLALWEQAAI